MSGRFISKCSRDLVSLKMSIRQFPMGMAEMGRPGPTFVLALKYRDVNSGKTQYAYERFKHEEHMKARFEGYFRGQCSKCLNVDFCANTQYADSLSEDFSS